MKASHEVNDDVEDGDLDDDQRYVNNGLRDGVSCWSVEGAVTRVSDLELSLPVDTYKLLCLSMIGRLEKQAVNSARAKRALKSSMKKSTPPRVKAPAEVLGML